MTVAVDVASSTLRLNPELYASAPIKLVHTANCVPGLQVMRIPVDAVPYV